MGKMIVRINLKGIEKMRYKQKENHKIKKLITLLGIIILVTIATIILHNMYLEIEPYQSPLEEKMQAERLSTTVEEKKEESKKIVEVIEEVNESIVGISKIKSNGSSIFSENGISELGIGTGVILSEDGYILTNWHVAGEKYSNCYITIENGKIYNGTVMWADSDLDLAIVKIAAKGLTPIKIGDSDQVQVAEAVYAVGNPIGFEFQKTVTSGIISAVDRTIKIEEENKLSYMEDLIQTDASINEGNSGGPLVNVNGEMIGITTIKIASVEGIGFAVPINTIKPIIQKFLQTGKFEEAFIGIYGFDREVIPYLNGNIEFDSGIYVDEVSVSGPSYKSGLQEGDIITQIDQVTLNKMSEFRNYIYQKQPGDNVTLKVLRNRREIEINITLGKRG